MKVSFFESMPYVDSRNVPPDWPVPPGYYEADGGVETFDEALGRMQFADDAGFDWISFSEHHYARSETPSPVVAAAHMAAHVKKAKVALLGPILPLNNPVRLAEELAMLDIFTRGRLVVGLLRGTSNEYQTYSVNPVEAREKTTEAFELVLRTWTEPQPFSWEGRYFQYRTVSAWPRPVQQPHPLTFALGSSKETCDFAAEHHLGLGTHFADFESMLRVTGYYRDQCARHGWEPTADHFVYRALSILVTDTDAEAEKILATPGGTSFPMQARVAEALRQLDKRNFVGEARQRDVNAGRVIRLAGSPATITEQILRCEEVVGAGVIDVSFRSTQWDDETADRSLRLFGREVLPAIQHREREQATVPVNAAAG